MQMTLSRGVQLVNNWCEMLDCDPHFRFSSDCLSHPAPLCSSAQALSKSEARGRACSSDGWLSGVDVVWMQLQQSGLHSSRHSQALAESGTGCIRSASDTRPGPHGFATCRSSVLNNQLGCRDTPVPITGPSVPSQTPRSPRTPRPSSTPQQLPTDLPAESPLILRGALSAANPPPCLPPSAAAAAGLGARLQRTLSADAAPRLSASTFRPSAAAAVVTPSAATAGPTVSAAAAAAATPPASGPHLPAAAAAAAEWGCGASAKQQRQPGQCTAQLRGQSRASSCRQQAAHARPPGLLCQACDECACSSCCCCCCSSGCSRQPGLGQPGEGCTGLHGLCRGWQGLVLLLLLLRA